MIQKKRKQYSGNPGEVLTYQYDNQFSLSRLLGGNARSPRRLEIIMFWKMLLLDIALWTLGILLLLFPIWVMQVYFLWMKKWYAEIPNAFNGRAEEFLLTLYSDPDSLNLKFPHSTEKIRIGGLILIILAISLIYRLIYPL